LGRLVELQAEYADRVAFLFVVIRDAGHPDAGSPAYAAKLGPDSPAEAWLALIRDSLDHYNISFTTLIDKDGAVERDYNAFPKRLVVIDTAGRITLDGSRGMGGGPSEWELAEVERSIESFALKK